MRNSLLLRCTVSALLLCTAGCAEDWQADSILHDGVSVRYQLYVKDDYASHQYPLVVALHGVGRIAKADGSNIDAQLGQTCVAEWARPESQTQYPCMILAPQCPTDYLWVNNNSAWSSCDAGEWTVTDDNESKALAAVHAAIEEVVSNYNIDANRVYLMGFSMGGWGTWDLLTRHGETFAASIPLAGAGDVTKADRLVDIPIYAFAGEVDGTVPSRCTRAICDSIAAAGGTKVNWEEIPAAGHMDVDSMWLRESYGAKEWLFNQTKGSTGIRPSQRMPGGSAQNAGVYATVLQVPSCRPASSNRTYNLRGERAGGTRAVGICIVERVCRER